MSDIEQAYAEHRAAVVASMRASPPIKAWLGAFINGAFTVLNAADPSTVWVRMASDDSPNIAKHKGKVNWSLTDQSIPVELYVDDNGKLSFYDWDTEQSGPVFQSEGGDLVVPPHTQAATTVTYTPTAPGDWSDPDPTTAQEALDDIAALLTPAAIDADVDARLLALLLEGRQLTRLTAMGAAGGRAKPPVVLALLKWPFGARR